MSIAKNPITSGQTHYLGRTSYIFFSQGCYHSFKVFLWAWSVSLDVAYPDFPEHYTSKTWSISP